MKKILSVLLAICLMPLCFACTGNPEQGNPPSETGTPSTPEQPGETGTPSTPEQPSETENPDEDNEEITAMYLYINENKLEVTLAQNSAVAALVDILRKEDITYAASDYGGFEKVGFLGHSLTTENNAQITTQPGDVMLYVGNQIVIFYGSNSWSYTRLGKVNGYSADELGALLGTGSVSVRISLK